MKGKKGGWSVSKIKLSVFDKKEAFVILRRSKRINTVWKLKMNQFA